MKTRSQLLRLGDNSKNKKAAKVATPKKKKFASPKKAEKVSLNERLSKFEFENIELTEKLADLNNRFDTVLTENQTIRIQHHKVEESLKMTIKDKNEIYEKMKALKEKLDSTEKVKSDLIKRIELKEKIQEENFSKINDLIDESNSIKKDFKNQLEKTTSLRKKNLEIDEEIQNVKSQLRISDSRADQKNKELIETKKRVMDSENSLKEKTIKIIELKKDLTEKNITLQTEIKGSKDRVAFLEKCIEDNKESKKQEKLKMEEIFSDLKFKLETESKNLNATLCKNELLEKQIAILKSSLENSEDQVSSLKSEIEKKALDLSEIFGKKQTQEEKEISNKTITNGYSQLENNDGSHQTPAICIREISAMMYPDYDPEKLTKFTADPSMTASELYLKFVSLYDTYKAAFKEKLAIEAGIKKYSEKSKSKTKRREKIELKFEMMKKAFSRQKNRMANLFKQITVKQDEVKALKRILTTTEAKRSSYKNTVRILRKQIQDLVRGKVGEKPPGCIFDDFNQMYEKHIKLKTDYNAKKKIWEELKKQLEGEKENLKHDFAEAQERWLEETTSYKKEINNFSSKIVYFEKVTKNQFQSYDGIKKARIGETEKKHQNIIEKLNESIKEIHRDRVHAISRSECEMIKLEKQFIDEKLANQSLKIELKHQKAIREISGKSLEDKIAELDSERLKLESVEKRFVELQQKNEENQLKLCDLKESKATALSKLESLEGMIEAMKSSEERYLEKSAEKDGLISIQNSKISRLEQTNKILADTEKQKIEKLLEDKELLQLEWVDLKKARELDLRTARENLQQTNNVARSALAELRNAKAETDAIKKEKESVENEKKAVVSRFKALQSEIADLKKFKSLIESADLDLEEVDAESSDEEETDRKKVDNCKEATNIEDKPENEGVKFGDKKIGKMRLNLSINRILNYERELQGIALKNKNLQVMFEAKSKLVDVLEKKLESKTEEFNKQIKKLQEEGDKTSNNLYKVASAYQANELDKAKLTESLQSEKEKFQKLFKNQKLFEITSRGKIRSLNENLKQKSDDLLKAVNEIKNSSSVYQGEVKRHGKTVQTLKALEKELNMEKTKLAEALNENSEIKKRLESNENSTKDIKDLYDKEKKAFNETVTRLKEKCSILSDELDSVNSLNRYLRRISTTERNLFVAKEGDKERENLDLENIKSDDGTRLEKYQNLLKDARDENTVLEKSLAAVKKEFNELSLKNTARVAKIDSLQSKLSSSLEKLKKLEDRDIEFKNQKDLENQIITLNENNQSLREKIHNHCRDKSKMSLTITELRKSITPQQAEISGLKEKVEILKMSISSKEELAAKWEKRCLDIFERNSFINPEDYQKMKKDLSQSMERLSKAETMHKKREKKLKSEIESLKNQLSESKEELIRNTEILKKKAALLKLREEELQKVLRKARDSGNEDQEAVRRKSLDLAKMRADFVKKCEQSKIEKEKMILNTKKLVSDVEKYKVLIRKLDDLLKEEKEMSTIYKRNAQTANARISERQEQLEQLTEKVRTLKAQVKKKSKIKDCSAFSSDTKRKEGSENKKIDENQSIEEIDENENNTNNRIFGKTDRKNNQIDKEKSKEIEENRIEPKNSEIEPKLKERSRFSFDSDGGPTKEVIASRPLRANVPKESALEFLEKIEINQDPFEPKSSEYKPLEKPLEKSSLESTMAGKTSSEDFQHPVLPPTNPSPSPTEEKPKLERMLEIVPKNLKNAKNDTKNALSLSENPVSVSKSSLDWSFGSQKSLKPQLPGSDQQQKADRAPFSIFKTTPSVEDLAKKVKAGEEIPSFLDFSAKSEAESPKKRKFWDKSPEKEEDNRKLPRKGGSRYEMSSLFGSKNGRFGLTNTSQKLQFTGNLFDDGLFSSLTAKSTSKTDGKDKSISETGQKVVQSGKKLVLENEKTVKMGGNSEKKIESDKMGLNKIQDLAKDVLTSKLSSISRKANEKGKSDGTPTQIDIEKGGEKSKEERGSKSEIDIEKDEENTEVGKNEKEIERRDTVEEDCSKGEEKTEVIDLVSENTKDTKNDKKENKKATCDEKKESSLTESSDKSNGDQDYKELSDEEWRNSSSEGFMSS